jgi:hypothetical protein
MKDRELLELAAKAAEYPIHSDAMFVKAGGGTETLYMGKNGPAWNPLTDDGDALRLAVKLRMRIDVLPWATDANPWNAYDTNNSDAIRHNEYPDDSCAATRRAIVRAAAEIGKAMP